jgi:hypothetical protein
MFPFWPCIVCSHWGSNTFLSPQQSYSSTITSSTPPPPSPPSSEASSKPSSHPFHPSSGSLLPIPPLIVSFFLPPLFSTYFKIPPFSSQSIAPSWVEGSWSKDGNIFTVTTVWTVFLHAYLFLAGALSSQQIPHPLATFSSQLHSPTLPPFAHPSIKPKSQVTLNKLLLRLLVKVFACFKH